MHVQYYFNMNIGIQQSSQKQQIIKFISDFIFFNDM